MRIIRQSLNLSQMEFSQGVMSQSNYSKVEKDIIYLSFTGALDLLNKINMTVDELLWIHNHHEIEYYNINRLMDCGINGVGLIELKKDIEKQEETMKYDAEILLVIESLLLFNGGQKIEAQKTTKIICQRLEIQGRLYYYDILILNCILPILPIGTAYSLYKMTLKKANSNKLSQMIHRTLIQVQISIITKLIKEGDYAKALNEVNELINELAKFKSIFNLSFAYIRKGYLLKLTNQLAGDFWMQKGFSILEASQLEDELKIMKEEVAKHLNQSKR